MITTAQMYWLTRLDSIQVVTFIVAFVPTIILFIWAFFKLVDFLTGLEYGLTEHEKIEALQRVKFSILWFVFCMVLWLPLCFIPSSREMAAIIVVPKIANSEKVQQAGNKIYDLAVEWMDALKPRQSKEAK